MLTQKKLRANGRDKIGKISMFSDFNENLYLGLSWSDELIGNDEHCIRMAAILKDSRDKIDKISMFSNFNENWYLGLFWNEELIGNNENCIHGHFNFQNGRQQNRENSNVL